MRGALGRARDNWQRGAHGGAAARGATRSAARRSRRRWPRPAAAYCAELLGRQRRREVCARARTRWMAAAGAVPTSCAAPASPRQRAPLRGSSATRRLRRATPPQVGARVYAGRSAVRHGRHIRIAPRACWSLEVSLATSAFVAGTVGALLARGGERARGHALFLGVFGAMQLVDASLWYEAAHAEGGLAVCTLHNRLATRAGISIIALEPVAALFGASAAAGRKNGPNPFVAGAYVLFYLVSPLVGSALLSPGEVAPSSTAQSCASGGVEGPPGVERALPVVRDCKRFPTRGLLLDLSAPAVCSTVTPGGHLQYGGMDIVYHNLLTPPEWGLEEVSVCELAPGELCEVGAATFFGSREIPLGLRLAYLLGMVIPYLQVKPRAAGFAHGTILTGTWMIGYFSDAHASVWCLANVAQGLLMLAEPAIWPGLPRDGTFPPLALAEGPTGAATMSSYDSESDAGGESPGGGAQVFAASVTTAKLAEPHPPPLPPRVKEKRYPFRENEVPDDLDAVIIGSGIGGLALGALLAKAGQKVLVLEAHYRPGGCTHAFTEIGENIFDSGIHYVGGAKGPMRTLLSHVCAHPIELAFMGSEKDGYTYDLFDMGDGAQPLYSYRAGELIESLTERFPHEADGIRSYIKDVRGGGILDNGVVLSKMLPDGKSVPCAGRLRSWLWSKVRARSPEVTARDKIAEYVKDPVLRALLSGGQMIDWNLAPGEVSWHVSAGMLNYYFDGGLYPAGSSNTIPQAIIPVIEAAGGKVMCSAPVSEILVEEEADDRTLRAVGVKLARGGKVVRARQVVSAAGYVNTYQRFLTEEVRARAGITHPERVLSKLRLSHSHVCAYISLNGPPEDFDLGPANIHSMPALSHYDYDIQAMQDAFYADPFCQEELGGCLMTLTCPSAKDPRYADDLPGRSNVLLLIEGLPEWFEQYASSKHGRRDEGYTELKRRFEPMFLERLYRYYPKTCDKITHLEISTPLSAAHFINSPGGASYGLDWRPEHFEEDLHEEAFSPTVRGIDGCYVTGESIAFGGFYGALVTAFATATHMLGLLPTLWLLANDHGAEPVMLKDGRPMRG